jgi:DNA helicase-2/ATP-dependent DNA helicase PcrA
LAWDDNLTGAALAVAQCEESPLRVMAGPGTGKTFAMKRWVTRVIEDGAEPHRILAVTFTRTAAADLVRELANLGVEGCEDIRAGTLHSYCFSLLRRQEVFEFLDRWPRPVITFKSYGVLRFEAEPLIHDLNNKHVFGDTRNRTKRILAFEAAWARLQSDEPGWTQNDVDQQFEDQLIKWLTFHHAILVGELVPLTLSYLRNNPECPELGAFDHVVVDEYQDLNKAEQVLIDQLAQDAKRVIVGDTDQSIYSFRHAHPDGIIEYHTTHANTHDELLVQCRRCPTRVVAIADSLIRRNHPAGAGPRLNPMPGNPEGIVKIVQWTSSEEEANGIAKFVTHLTADEGYAAGQIMILSPRRKLGYGIRDALLQQDVPVHSFYHEEMLEGEGTQRGFALLALAANPEDRVALRFWLGYASPTWRSNAYKKLVKHCDETGQSPWLALESLASGALKISGTAELVKRFKELRAELAAIAPLVGTALIDYLFPESEEENNAVREAAYLADVDDKNLGETYEALTSVVTQPATPDEGEYVRVMSLHKSKGLTSKAVIVAGCIDGLIPYLQSDWTPAEREANIQEQRRLFYVVLTRATDILIISSFATIDRQLSHKIGARVKTGYEKQARTISSMFLRELGPSAPPPQTGRTWSERNFE